MIIPLVATALLQAPQPQPLDRALLEAAVQPVMDAEGVPGAVVALTRGGSVVMVEAFGVRDVATAAPMPADALFMVGSITKQFTATLLALLAEDGVLSLDDPVAQHLDPAQPLPAWAQRVTLRQLATHTAGLPREPVNRRNVPNSPSVMQPYSRAELYEGLSRTELEAEPGARWSYSNLGYAVLGEVVERAGGEPYEALLHERVLAPGGLEDTGVRASAAQEDRFPSGYWPEDTEPVARPRWVIGEVVGFGGLFSSASDLARFLIAQTASGPEAPLSEAVRSMLHTPLVDTGAPGRRQATAWMVQAMSGGMHVIGGGGEVDSFSGAIAFLERPRAGIVVLANRGDDSAESIIRAVMGKVLPVLLARR